MRNFVDASGRRWDVAVSDESYGTQRLIFAARAGGELRGHVLETGSRHEAEQMLLQLSEDELCALLAIASEWRPG